MQAAGMLPRSHAETADAQEAGRFGPPGRTASIYPRQRIRDLGRVIMGAFQMAHRFCGRLQLAGVPAPTRRRLIGYSSEHFPGCAQTY